MPLYTYKCLLCESVQDAFRSVEERDITPACKCGGDTEKIITCVNIAPMFKPYRAVAGDQRMIYSRDQHRKFLAENNLVEVGNDKSILPKE